MTDDTAALATTFVGRGWSVIALHDVSAGVCSCGSDDPEHAAEQGGKHPIAKAWQLPSNQIRTGAQAREVWARRPSANIGIVTGRASGVWVLDVDPKNAGDDKLRSLVATYGMLPETYTVRTGSGGLHYYYRMPDFDFTTSRGRLPIGLDVRGNQGQVVAPPSSTMKGGYSVLLDVPVVDAPAWLLALIKPESKSAPTGDAFGVGGGDGRWAAVAGEALAVTESVADRGRRYANEAVGRLLWEMSTAVPGSRNDTAYRLACRLAELVAAPWSGLSGAAVGDAFMRACEAANTDGGFSAAEARECLDKGIRHVGGRGAILPTPDFMGEWTDWGIPAVAASFFGGGTAPTDSDHVVSDSTSGALTPPPAAGAVPPPSEAAGVDAYRAMFEQMVTKRMVSLDVDVEAKRRRLERDAPTRGFIERLLTGSMLRAVPRPTAVVKGFLFRDTLARVWGPSGAGKSFVTVDMACSVAAGKPWHDAPVERGIVVYVVGEGLPGMQLRHDAWCMRHGVDDSGVLWLPMPVQIMGPEWDRFVVDMAGLGPALIVMDTQARVTVGVNENDNSEMNGVVAALDRLRVATKACVLLVHHQGTGEADRARGASAVKGAMDTELSVSGGRDNAVVIKSAKQKDVECAPDVVLTKCAMGESLVLLTTTETRTDPVTGFIDPVTPQMSIVDRRALAMARVLIDGWRGSQGATRAEVTTAWMADPSNTGQPVKYLRGNAGRVWARLERLGRLAINPAASGRFLFVEIEGVGHLEPNPDLTTEFGWPVAQASIKDKSGTIHPNSVEKP